MESGSTDYDWSLLIPRLVDHNDTTVAPLLTQHLINLIPSSQAAQATSAALELYSALHALLSPLLLASPGAPLDSFTTAVQRPKLIASYLIDSLVPALHASEHPYGASAVADVLLDVVWQLDQQIDSGTLVWSLTSAAHPSAMDVDDSSSAPPPPPPPSLKDDPATRLVRDREARERLGDLVQQLVAAHLLTKQDCLERLDTTFLSCKTLHLLKDPNFPRFEVRARTALYYKQQKFNLLREESEGYAKLVVELLSNMGPAHATADGRSQEGEKARLHRAESVNDKIKSLIGNFDLDPDRTLDIILDTFSDQLVHHHQFFLDLLAVSPWAAKHKLAPHSQNGKGKGKEPLVDVGIDSDQGSFLIGQILGFKFAYYQGETAEDAPEQIYLMAALLIWNGFVKLGDLWPHLSPADDWLLKTEDRYREEQSRLASSVGGANALAMAGALVDDDAPVRASASSASKTAAAAASAPVPKRDPPLQKLALLRALLSIGDLAHSLFILAQFKDLVPTYLDLADLLNRLLATSIQPAYYEISVEKSKGQYQDEFASAKPKYVAADKKTTTPPAARPTYLSGRAFPDPNKDFTFFFAEWRDRLPRCGDWEEVLQVLETVYGPWIGVFISRDFGLYTKICRIIVNDLTTTPDNNPRRARWVDIIRQHLLPGLSLLEHHSAGALEIWTVLSLLPIEQRYQLYGEWKDTLYRRVPALSVRKAEAERDVKSILRRLSTENVKKLGKTLARVAHTNPTIIFAVMLGQVQSYDNLIVPVIDAARYLSDFGYDVLTFSLLDALCSGKSKTKEDGTSVALWLQSLASFAGQLYRRWPAMQSSLWIVLQYLVNQLVSNNSKDLVVLRELIGRMTGIEPFADLSDAQVLSLAGGTFLRSEVFFQTEISQAGKKATLASLAAARDRLTLSLRTSKLAIPLLVNIAIQRQKCVETEAHLKSIGALFDQNHAVLFQYMEFLGAVIDPDDFARLVPTVGDLINRFGIEPSVAFDIGRSKLRLAIREHDAKDARIKTAERKAQIELKLQQEKLNVPRESTPSTSDAGKAEQATVASALDTVMADDSELSAPDPSAPLATNGDLAMSDVAPVSTPPIASSPVPRSVVPWHPGLVEAIQTSEVTLPLDVQKTMGAPFYVTFWQLTLYDIFLPLDRYEAELARLNGLQREVGANTTLKPEDRDAFTRKLLDLAGHLNEEVQKHHQAKGTASKRLSKESKFWFPNVRLKADREALANNIIQRCILPRAKLSLPDAVYAYQFVKRLHTINAPGFHAVVMYDKLLAKHIGPTLYACSENEARNYARFLCDLLQDVHRWYSDIAAYKKEAIGSPHLNGFIRVYPSPTSTAVPEEKDFLSHHDMQGVAEKWHSRMVTSFRESFESGEYTHIKNSILVLTKIAPFFPIDYAVGSKLEDAVTALIAVEKREDLKILAQGYKAVISKRRKHWVNQPKSDLAPPAVSKPASPVASAATAASSTASASTVSTRPTPTGPSSTSSALPNIPTAPKHSSLPSRPGTSRTSTPSARPSDATTRSTAMDVDKPAPASNETRRPPVGPAATTNGAASSSSGRAHSSLPARPSTGNGAPDASALREQALASQRRSQPASTATTAMDPPPAPSTLRTSTTTTAATTTTSSSQREATSTASRPASRPASPRGSDSSRRTGGRSDSERDKGRDRERRDRASSVESSHSSKGRKDKDSRSSSGRDHDRNHRDRDSRPRDRERDVKSTSRRSDDAGGSRRGDRDDRHSSSSRPSAEDDRRRVEDKRRADDKSRADDKLRADDKSRADERRRDEDRYESRHKESSSRRGPDRLEPPRGTSSATASSRTAAPPRSNNDRPSTTPTGPKATRNIPTGPAAQSLGDRLKPAPASRQADVVRPSEATRLSESIRPSQGSSTRAPESSRTSDSRPSDSRAGDSHAQDSTRSSTSRPRDSPSGTTSDRPTSLSIKGGGGGASRLFSAATSDRRNDSSSRRPSESRSSSNRDESSGSSNKRILERIGDDRAPEASSSKRPRTDEHRGRDGERK